MKRVSLLFVVALLAACQFKIDRKLEAGQIKATLLATGTAGEVPAAGARVSIENSLIHVTADSKGAFVLRGLVAGDYTLRITYATQSGGAIDAGLRLLVHLDSGGGNGLANSRDLGKISLVGLGDVAGTVVSGATPFVGATVLLEGFAETTSTATGFAFPNLLSGDYFVSVLAVTDPGTASEARHIQAHVAVHVAPKATTTVLPFDVAQILAASSMGGSAQGLVRLTGTGSSNAGIQVSILPVGAPLETDSAGDYLLSSAPPGVYTVTASQGGFLTVKVPFVMISDDTTLVPPMLLPAATPDCGIDGTTSSSGTLGDVCTCAVGDTSDPFDPCLLNENKPCLTDVQCSAGEFCDSTTTPKSCQGCSTNQAAHCGAVTGGGPGCNVCSAPTAQCVNSVCVGCTSDIDCTTGQYCGAATTGAVKTCLSCSQTDAQHCGGASTPVGCSVCSGLTPACVAGACASCVGDQNCPTGQYCFIGQTSSLCTACTMSDPLHCGSGCAVCSGQTPECVQGVCSPAL